MSESYRHFPGVESQERNEQALKDFEDWFEWLYHNKGDRAALRRCRSPEDVFMTAGFRQLYRRFYDIVNPDSERFVALACAAGVLSHVKEQHDEKHSFAAQMAQRKPESDQPQVSELRFAQLQKSYSWEEFYRRLIRTVRLMGGNVNIQSLADAIFHWGKEFEGRYERQPLNRLQVRWAADYYQVLNRA